MKFHLKPYSLIYCFILTVFLYKLLTFSFFILRRKELAQIKFLPLTNTTLYEIENREVKLLQLKAGITEIEDFLELKKGISKKFDFLQPTINNPYFCINKTIEETHFDPYSGWVKALKSEVFIDTFIYVHSAVGHFKQRKLVRETWGKKNLLKGESSRVLFVVGLTQDKNTQTRVEEEFKIYGDLLQGNFIDTYKNITYKGVLSIRWITEYCSNVKVVIKTDDDSLLNIFGIKYYVNKITSQFDGPFLACSVYKQGTIPILRDQRNCSKWCVSKKYLSNRLYYPTYCSGLIYVMNMKMIKSMVLKVNKTSFFWIDDVYITGMLVQNVNGMRHFDIKTSLFYNSAMNEIKIGSKPTITAVHLNHPTKIIKMWNFLLSKLTPNEKAQLNYDIKDLYFSVVRSRF